MKNNPQFFTIKQVAEILNCSVHHVYRLCEQGHLNHMDISMGLKKQKCYRISQNDLDYFLEAANEKAPALTGAVKPRYIKEI